MINEGPYEEKSIKCVKMFFNKLGDDKSSRQKWKMENL